MENIKRRLIKDGFNVDEIKKIEKILKEEKCNYNNVPNGEIKIQIIPSRSRIGTTLIAKVIKNVLEQVNYKVEYKFYDSNCEEYHEFNNTIQKILSDNYERFKICFTDIINPRANIIISLPESYKED